MNSNQMESTQLRSLAAAIFAVGVLSGYGLSTQVGADDASRLAIPSVPSMQQSQTYFPSQYQNQAAMTEDHIQAF